MRGSADPRRGRGLPFGASLVVLAAVALPAYYALIAPPSRPGRGADAARDDAPPGSADVAPGKAEIKLRAQEGHVLKHRLRIEAIERHLKLEVPPEWLD